MADMRDEQARGRETPFGLRSDGWLAAAWELTERDRGSREYRCPDCGRDLEVVLPRGDSDFTACFRHWKKTHGCPGGPDEGIRGETGLHILAKELLVDVREFAYPASVARAHSEDRSVVLEGEARPAGTYRFSRALTERAARDWLAARLGKDPGLRPDVLLLGDDGSHLLVEIWVKHGTGQEKRRRLRELGLPCVEVFLGEGWLAEDGYDKECLSRLLAEGDGPEKQWLWDDRWPATEECLAAECERQAAEGRDERDRAEERGRRESEERARQAAEEAVRAAAAEERIRELEEEERESARQELERKRETTVAYLLRQAEAQGGHLPREWTNVPVPHGDAFAVPCPAWQWPVFKSWVMNKERKLQDDPNQSLTMNPWSAAKMLMERHPELAADGSYAAGRVEEAIREYFGALDGFGLMAPIPGEWDAWHQKVGYRPGSCPLS